MNLYFINNELRTSILHGDIDAKAEQARILASTDKRHRGSIAVIDLNNKVKAILHWSTYDRDELVKVRAFIRKYMVLGAALKLAQSLK